MSNRHSHSCDHKNHSSQSDHHDDHEHDGHSHTHNHHDHDHHMIKLERPPTRAFQLSILINFLFVLVEIYFGYFSNSLSMLADAGHNLGDVFSLALAWLGYQLTQSRPTSRFSFGLKKFSILASLINSLILVIGSAWVLYEAYERFQTSGVQNGVLMMAVAAVGIVINFGSALLFQKGQHHDLNMKGAYLHLMADALVSLGVVVTGLFVYWKQLNWIDPVMSVIIVAVILYGTWDLLKESWILILGGVPSVIKINEVQNFFKKQKGVLEVSDLRIWALSTSEYALNVKLIVDTQAEYTNSDLAEIEHQLEEQFQIGFINMQMRSKN